MRQLEPGDEVVIRVEIVNDLNAALKRDILTLDRFLTESITCISH
jgi:hypothetical protein